jgi:hypothetical protein
MESFYLFIFVRDVQIIYTRTVSRVDNRQTDIIGNSTENVKTRHELQAWHFYIGTLMKITSHGRNW